MINRKNINSLTGLRGIAALWVFSLHIRGFIEHILGRTLSFDNFTGHGYLGVDIFFILSGFIMTYVHYDDFRSSIRNQFKRFLILRFWRIYPLHIAVMLAIVVAVTASPSLKNFIANGSTTAFNLISFLQSITLTQAWGYYWQGLSWNGVSWTLSAEWLDYLAFPFLIFAVRNIKVPALNLLLGCAVLVTLGMVLKKVGLIDINATHFGGLGRAVLGFTADCFLCRFYTTFRQPFPAGWACSASLLFIGCCFSAPTTSPFIYTAFGVLILSLAYMPKFYGALFGRGFSYWLGKISFSFYLTHLMLLNVISWAVATNGWNGSPVWDGVWIVASPLFCLAVAALCYEAIERPSHRIARKITAKPRPPDITPLEDEPEIEESKQRAA